MKPTKQELVEASTAIGLALDVTPFPVCRKQPRTPAGTLSWRQGAQSWDPQLHRVWWTEATDPDGIGVVLPAPYVVVDLDPQVVEGDQSVAYLLAKDELASSLMDLSVRRLGLPRSAPRVLTGKGMHVWVRLRNGSTTPNGKEVNHLLREAVLELPVSDTGEVVKVRVQADLKGNGTGYVVCPPSWSEAAHRCYEWIHQPLSRDDLPEWSPEDGLIAPLVSVWTRGRRHHLALCTAGVLAKAEAPQERAEELIRRVAELAGDEELPNRVQAVSDTYSRYAKGEDVLGKAGLEMVLPSNELSTVLSALDTLAPQKCLQVMVTELVDHRALAITLASLWRGKWMYATHAGKWMKYEHGVWTPATSEHAIRVASDCLYDYYQAAIAQAKGDRHQVHRITDLLRQTCRTDPIRQALVMLAGTEGYFAGPEAWDANPDLLNLRNGTLNLKTLELQPHNPDDLLTKQAPVEYRPNATSKAWQEHLDLVLPDPDIRRQVQRDLGAALSGRHDDAYLPIWYGTGRNGKTTTYLVIERMLGKNVYVGKAAENLLVYRTYSEHPTELADLQGLRMVFSVEIGEKKRLNVERVTSLTGGEDVKARYMRQDYFSFSPTFTIFLLVNFKPIVEENVYAIWRRLRLIPWTQVIPSNKCRGQSEVVEEMSSGENGSAVLNWMLDGLYDYRANKLWIANEVRAATEEYRVEMDRVGAFVEECCELHQGARVPAAEVYRVYLRWCEETGETPLKPHILSRRLINYSPEGSPNTYISTVKSNGVRYYTGIRLRDVPTVVQSELSDWDE